MDYYLLRMQENSIWILLLYDRNLFLQDCFLYKLLHYAVSFGPI